MKDLAKYRTKLKLDRMQLSKWLGVHYMALRRYELGEQVMPFNIYYKYEKILKEYEIFLNKIK